MDIQSSDAAAFRRGEPDSSDHLHPNDKGMRALADTVDLGLLRG